MNRRDLLPLHPFVLYVGISLSIATFLFKPGHLFLLDMVVGSKIDLADYTASGIAPHFPLTFLQYLTNFVLPADLIQKLMLFAILMLIAIGMYRFTLLYLNRWWACIAGLIYLLNPYVFERFAAGQWLILLGYGYFPFVIHSFISLLSQPNRRNFIIFNLLYAFFPIISIHWWYMGSGILILYLGTYLAINKSQLRPNLKPILEATALLLLSFLLINSFWLLSFSSPEKAITQISVNDLPAFYTTSDPNLGIWGNVLSLYGFWSTEFILPKDLNPYWWLATICTATLSLIGLIALRLRDKPLTLTLVIAIIIATLIAVGYASPLTKSVTIWLTEYFPGFKGLRDTAKVIGIISFCYALLAPLGAKWLANWITAIFSQPSKAALFTASLLALSLPFTTYPSMINSFGNQLQPTSYPSSWNKADQILRRDHATKVLILPWHGYLGFNLSQNRPIANPGRVFFTPPVVSSSYLDNPHLDISQTTYDHMVFDWLQNPMAFKQDESQLKRDRISHILLFKTVDYRNYHFLAQQSDLERRYDSPEITLFKIKL